jgi:hypothetical protein
MAGSGIVDASVNPCSTQTINDRLTMIGRYDEEVTDVFGPWLSYLDADHPREARLIERCQLLPPSRPLPELRKLRPQDRGLQLVTSGVGSGDRCVYFSTLPWSRIARSRAASSGSLVTIAPASP